MAENKPQLPPESHYNPKKLDKIFAIVAIVLLLSLIGIFAKDYSRQWKEYQRQFRILEVEKAHVKLDAENNTLAKNEEYQALLKQLAETQAKLGLQNVSIKEIQKDITNIEIQKRLNTKYYQDTKAELDALKYQYETALNQSSPKEASLKIRLENLTKQLEQYHLKLENNDRDIAIKNKALKNIEKDFRDLDKKRMGITKKQEILSKKIKRIDEGEMSVANQIAEHVRDLPLIDLANPNYKIKQIVLKDIPEDVNFMKVPRVDRCTTCHLGIDNPDFKDAAQPFRTHPNLELYLSKNSSHPIDQFACTSCHMGRGRATDFTSAAHTPQNEGQKKIWEKKYGWQELHHWDQPMLAKQYTEAGCLKCHGDQGTIKGAEKLNLGLTLIERAGCYGCHTIEKYKNWPKSGPSLEFVASKISKEWAYRWIEDPKSIRPNAWMPSYFNQSNNNDPASIKRSQQEILSIVEFIFSNSKPYEKITSTIDGDAKNGKELVASLGCTACHITEPLKNERTRDSLHREFGPNLIGIGSKTDKAWLVDWLKNPNRYHPDTRMPSLRLNDKESADIAEYLLVDKTNSSRKIPAVDEKILNQIVLDFLKKSNSLDESNNQLKAMNTTAKLTFAGQRLVREYGCFSCHQITGFENEKPIGVELTQEGTKSLERLEFGFVPIEHTKEGWFEQKLLNPRIFDQGKVKESLEKLKMPNFKFTHKEAEAVTTVLMGLVKDRPNPAKMPNSGVKAQFINEGQKTIRQLNCQACHQIEKEGGTIQSSVIDWLVNYDGKDANDAKAVVRSFSPPDLIGEGQKVQAQWLFEFLHDPMTIRPWLKVRMPTYNFHGGQINTLVKYFNYLDDQEFPFTDIYHPDLTKEEFTAAEKLFSKDYFGCAQCHIVGDQMPAGSVDSWAPNFALAAKRLKPEWIIKWLTNPADLLPGTKMPTYFDPKNFSESGPPDVLNGDEKLQIKALRDYLLTITSHAQESKKEEPQTEKAQVMVNAAK